MPDKYHKQFVDTNVLVYAHDVSAGVKHERAKELIAFLWESGRGYLSIQVLQEFYVTVTRKVARPISPQAASKIIDDIGTWHVHSPRVEDVLLAVDIQERNRLSFWDAMIVCSASRMGCDLIWTEDLSTGQEYEKIPVVSPF